MLRFSFAGCCVEFNGKGKLMEPLKFRVKMVLSVVRKENEFLAHISQCIINSS